MSVVTVSTFNKKFQLPPQPSHLLATLWQVPRRLILSEKKKEGEKKSSSVISKLLKVTRGSLREGAEVTLRCAALTARRIPPSLSVGVSLSRRFQPNIGFCWLPPSNRCGNIKYEKRARKANGKKKFYKRKSKNREKIFGLPLCSLIQLWFSFVRALPRFLLAAVSLRKHRSE